MCARTPPPIVPTVSHKPRLLVPALLQMANRSPAFLSCSVLRYVLVMVVNECIYTGWTQGVVEGEIPKASWWKKCIPVGLTSQNRSRVCVTVVYACCSHVVCPPTRVGTLVQETATQTTSPRSVCPRRNTSATYDRNHTQHRAIPPHTTPGNTTNTQHTAIQPHTTT
jgi:hypothetical protein